MANVDDIVINKLKKLSIKIDIYKRYLDDIFTVAPPINQGWEYDNKLNIMV